jgi:hypothetical protein
LNQVLSKRGSANLVSWYPVLWNGRQFHSLYEYTLKLRLKQGLEGQIKAQKHGGCFNNPTKRIKFGYLTSTSNWGLLRPSFAKKIGTKRELMLKTGEQTCFVTYTGPQGSFIPSFEFAWPVPWTLDKKVCFHTWC